MNEQTAAPEKNPQLQVAGALGGSVVIYSDVESYHLSSQDALELSESIKNMAGTVNLEVNNG